MKISKIYTQFIDKNKYNTVDDNKRKIDSNNKSSVNIEISKSAKDLVKTMEQLEDTNISERVERIRKSFLDGTYKVSSDDIADKILDHIDKQKGRIK